MSQCYLRMILRAVYVQAVPLFAASVIMQENLIFLKARTGVLNNTVFKYFNIMHC